MWYTYHVPSMVLKTQVTNDVYKILYGHWSTHMQSEYMWEYGLQISSVDGMGGGGSAQKITDLSRLQVDFTSDPLKKNHLKFSS